MVAWDSPKIDNLHRMAIRRASRHSLLDSTTIKVFYATHYDSRMPYASNLNKTVNNVLVMPLESSGPLMYKVRFGMKISI